MNLSLLDDLLWGAAFLLNAFLFVILIWRGRWRRFPVLTCWMAYEVALSTVLYALYANHAFGAYSRVYWASLWPDFLLQVGAIGDLARIVLRRNGKWVRGARSLLIVAGAVAVTVAAVLTWLIHPPHGALAVSDLRSDLFTSLITCQLLIAISIIANGLGLAWPNEPLAVAQALTAWSAVTLIVNALQSYFGARNFRLINHFQSYAWIGAVVWIAIEFGAPRSHDCLECQPSPAPAASMKAPSGMLRPLSAGFSLARGKLRSDRTALHRCSSLISRQAHSLDEAST